MKPRPGAVDFWLVLPGPNHPSHAPVLELDSLGLAGAEVEEGVSCAHDEVLDRSRRRQTRSLGEAILASSVEPVRPRLHICSVDRPEGCGGEHHAPRGPVWALSA